MCFLPVSVWVSSWYSSFLPHSKKSTDKLIGFLWNWTLSNEKIVRPIGERDWYKWWQLFLQNKQQKQNSEITSWWQYPEGGQTKMWQWQTKEIFSWEMRLGFCEQSRYLRNMMNFLPLFEFMLHWRCIKQTLSKSWAWPGTPHNVVGKKKVQNLTEHKTFTLLLA